jgi:hypothetical protein
MHTEYLSNLFFSKDTSTSVLPAVLGVCFGVCVSFLKLLANEIVGLDPFSPLPTGKNWATIPRIVQPRTWISALSLFTRALSPAPRPSLRSNNVFISALVSRSVWRVWCVTHLMTVACRKGCCGDRRSDSTAWMHSVCVCGPTNWYDPQIGTNSFRSYYDCRGNRKLLRRSGLEWFHDALFSCDAGGNLDIWWQKFPNESEGMEYFLLISRCQIICVNF